ncbi:MAG: glycoside hydrolase family 38 C-terminal domain-containing protein [Eubacteriales bacterium]|nr:glycoside hydrolase family 38 C-terminal domain-containing protein [Eubacteriales bacterium]
MEFTKKQILEKKLDGIRQMIEKKCIGIGGWETRTGFYEAPQKYVGLSEWEAVSPGDTWVCRDSLTRWYRTEFRVPDNFGGKNTVLELEVGGEAIVYVNGTIRSALTSFIIPNEVTRTRVYFPKEVADGEKIKIEIEAHMNYMEFAKYRDQGQTEIIYTFRRADLVVVDEEAETYYFDVKTAFDTMQALKSPVEDLAKTNVNLNHSFQCLLESMTKDSYTCHKLRDAVLESLTAVDLDDGRNAFSASIRRAAEILRSKLALIPSDGHALIKFVGQAHIDTAWRWPVKESVRKCAKTMSNVLDLMDRYEDFVFAFSQPCLFEFTKRYYPELFERIKEKVSSGQFELVGNAWVEMDTNIPSGESIVRQLLYGKQFYEKEFGKSSTVFWMPDVFGYSWALPQIMARSGIKYFFTSKLVSNDTNNFPHSLFNWQGIDGTRILSYVQKLNYNGVYDPSHVDTIYNRFSEKDITEHVLMTYGYGDGGGGPSYKMLETGRRLKAFPGLQKTEMNSSVSFFEEVECVQDKLPVWNDEMYYEYHRGTYTTQARTKKNNRKAEFAIRRAELLAVLAYVDGGAVYPYEDILEVYKLILTNQFHDIIPGSSIPEVYRVCEADYSRVFVLICQIQDKSLMHITAEADEHVVTVFNTLGWERQEIVCAELPRDMESCIVVDPQGVQVPCVIAGENVEFEVRVPAFSGVKYTLVQDNETCEKNNTWGMEMENSYYRLCFNSEGELFSLYDKTNRREVLAGVSNVFHIFEDKPAVETAWNIDLEYQNKQWKMKTESARIIRRDRIKQIFHLEKSFHKSRISQDIVIYSNNPRIDFETRVEWYETEKMLKTSFEADVLAVRAWYEIQYGAISRPTHWNTSYDKAKFEVCAHKWADLSEHGYGVSLMNDCKYGYDIKGNCMRLTLLRAPVDPDPNADRGIHTFVYSLLPHKGDYGDGGTVEHSYALNEPLVVIPKREIKEYAAYVKVAEKGIVVDAVKCAEAGCGVIVRLYEAYGAHHHAKMSLRKEAKEIWECNLMEENEHRIAETCREIEFSIKPYEIKSFCIFHF